LCVFSVFAFFTFSPLSISTFLSTLSNLESTMRLIKQNDDDLAAEEAMRGGAIGALKYCAVATFLGAVLQATSPRFRAIRPPQKVLGERGTSRLA